MHEVLCYGFKVDDNIIEVDQRGFPLHPEQHNGYGLLEGSGRVFQTELQANKAVQPAMRRERSLVAVFFGDLYLPMSAVTIRCGKDSSVAERVDALIYPL